jgi:hypothetical protein
MTSAEVKTNQAHHFLFCYKIREKINSSREDKELKKNKRNCNITVKIKENHRKKFRK